MNFPEVLQRIATALGHAGIPYMLTGSFASVFYASPRSTQDIDLVIETDANQLHRLAESLPVAEYYFDLAAALDALKRESLFNVIDQKTGWKVDMIIRKSRAFSREEFQRRQRVTTDGGEFFIASAEDVILAKLEWSKLGQSQRQVEDSARILEIHWASLDKPYLKRWLSELKLEKEWVAALQLVGIADLNTSPE
jgi:hypothetical protein